MSKYKHYRQWHDEMGKILKVLNTDKNRASIAERVDIPAEKYELLNCALGEVIRCCLRQHREFILDIDRSETEKQHNLSYSQGAANSYEEILNIVDSILQ